MCTNITCSSDAASRTNCTSLSLNVLLKYRVCYSFNARHLHPFHSNILIYVYFKTRCSGSLEQFPPFCFSLRVPKNFFLFFFLMGCFLVCFFFNLLYSCSNRECCCRFALAVFWLLFSIIHVSPCFSI